MPQVSTHIEEIIEKKPNWLIRAGISGMLLLLLTLLFVAWWVQYPDVIKAGVYISTPKPPIDLICPSNAQIEKIFIKDAERKIAKGNPLILLKSTSDYREIQKLQLYVGALEKESLTENHSIIPSNFVKLGEEGHGISQGQKQRILIARVIYKNPPLIIFDEATNTLDAMNEKIILENVKKKCKNKMMVVVAHRLSTIKEADQILVLEKGKIVEQGNHENLLELAGVYSKLIKNQS